MTNGELVHLLRNTPVQKLIKALEKDGFVLKRATQSGGHIYFHPLKKKIAIIHFHHKSDILTRKTLKSFLEGTQWTKEDLKRLKLLK
jgi:predicted RNA binding protein YcfA (HicA-like mRNA interferase family)